MTKVNGKPTMKLVSSKKGIVHVDFPNRKELTFTMGRIGEYYESGNSNLRGKVFTLEDFLDTFMDDSGKLTYYNDWSGYNIPGEKFLAFFALFELTKREENLYRLVSESVTQNPFYVIATYNGDVQTLDHEVAHGLYYLNKDYKREADKLVKNMKKVVKVTITEKLLEWGYGKSVLTDELNAYMATSPAAYMKSRFKLTNLDNDMKPFRQLFKKYKKEYENE